jgi:hypothetical protein
VYSDPQAYTAHGYQVNPYVYQQQQAAAMRMAQQQQQLSLAQVREVEEQMRHLKMRQGVEPSLLGNGQPFMQPARDFPAGNLATAFPQSGGQTLNPHLW